MPLHAKPYVLEFNGKNFLNRTQQNIALKLEIFPTTNEYTV